MTQILTRTFFSLGLAALATCLPSAHAAPDSTCPAEAEQRLYDMETAIRQGTQKDPVAIVTLAEWAIETCPDRPDAQAIAATLMSAAVNTTRDLDLLERYVTLMLTAIQQNDYAWRSDQKPSVLKQADGSEADYFGYSTASAVLTGTALPYLTGMAGAGRIHPAISGEPLGTCPYSEHAAFRLESEARLWDMSVKHKYGEPLFGLAETRLAALREACPNHRRDLDFYFIRLYGQEIDYLTGWKHNFMESMNSGNGGYYWAIPAIADPIFSDAIKEQKKIELDAKARPLVDKLQPYLSSFFDPSSGEMTASDKKYDEAAMWRNMPKRLNGSME